MKVLEEYVDYYGGGTGTALEHLKKAIDFTRNNLGAHGFPLILHSNWNGKLFRVCKECKEESAYEYYRQLLPMVAQEKSW